MFKKYSNNNQDNLLQNSESINLKSDWKDNLGLNKDETVILTFFVNALKDELTKTYTSAAHFNVLLKGDVSKIEGYIKRFLLKLNDKGKVKELLKYIKYGKDNPPNVDGRDDKLNIDAKDHYKIEKRLADAFDNYFMFLNPPIPGPPIEENPEEKVFELIQNVCYEYRNKN
ncbi:hypothetical protein [Borrelia puertoricensis]|uniref:hypothetical protein n=1 Tax=Borrelia puertoricensis TaxID=2756107 RepID=UPI003EBF048E